MLCSRPRCSCRVHLGTVGGGCAVPRCDCGGRKLEAETGGSGRMLVTGVQYCECLGFREVLLRQGALTMLRGTGEAS